MAQNDDTSVSYVMILDIKKIMKVTNRQRAYNTAASEETKKTETEIIKLVIRDSKLAELLERGGQHLQLVKDDTSDHDA